MESGDAYKTTAWYYARYRAPYPQEFLKEVIEHYQLKGGGRLLDLGCGTGHLAIALAPHFEHVVGVDPEPEMLVEAKRSIETARINNITLLVGRAEELSVRPASFRLVTIGRSFHWMDREKVLRILYTVVEPGGGVIIVTDNDPWRREAPFHRKVREILQTLIGEQRRAGSGIRTSSGVHSSAFIWNSSFEGFVARHFIVEERWTIDQVIGSYLGFSFSSPAVLGLKRQVFETTVREELAKLDPSGTFSEEVTYEAFFLRRN